MNDDLDPSQDLADQVLQLLQAAPRAWPNTP